MTVWLGSATIYQTEPSYNGAKKKTKKKSSACKERQTCPLVEEEASLLNTYMSRREQKSWS
jgi:hypothetical protein